MQRTEWFNRKFPLMEDNGILPSIIERLAGTPVRVEELTKELDENLLTVKQGGKWSIKEEIGHLSDMEPLWLGRVDDFVNRLPELTAADLTNRKTHEANHNATPLHLLLDQFRRERARLVAKLMSLDEHQLLHSSLHPRLKTPMRVIDLAYFVAEHDDHHLAGIREIVHIEAFL
jgi:uncharacterized damage-inducible protein DinB